MNYIFTNASNIIYKSVLLAMFLFGITTMVFAFDSNYGISGSAAILGDSIICPDNIAVRATPGDCGRKVTYDDPIVIPDSNDFILVAGIPSGSIFPIGTTTQVFETYDASGNVASCSFKVRVRDLRNDLDCDGVSVACDVCPYVDDNVDHNQDGLPDCEYFPGVRSFDPSWQCDGQSTPKKSDDKYFMCRLNQNGTYNTLCVPIARLQGFYNRGAKYGPCTDCGNTRMAADNEISTTDIQIFPNPAVDELFVVLEGFNLGPVDLEFYDVLGRFIQKKIVNYYGETLLTSVDLSSNFSSGRYIVKAIQLDKMNTQTFIISKN